MRTCRTSALLHGGAGQSRFGGLPWSGFRDRTARATTAVLRRCVGALRVRAGRYLRAWIAKALQAHRGTREGVPVFRRKWTCADQIDRHGAGLRGLQLNSKAERAAMRQLILRSTPPLFPADALRVSRRFTGPRSPCVAAPGWGLDDSQVQPGRVASAQRAPNRLPSQRTPRGDGGPNAAG
jgi:hypothetical protein